MQEYLLRPKFGGIGQVRFELGVVAATTDLAAVVAVASDLVTVSSVVRPLW